MDKCYNGNHDRDRDGNCLTCPMTEPAKEWGEKLSRRVMQAPPDVNAAEVLAYEIAPLLSKASAYDKLEKDYQNAYASGCELQKEYDRLVELNKQMGEAIDGAMVTAVNPRTHPDAFSKLEKAKDAFKAQQEKGKP